MFLKGVNTPYCLHLASASHLSENPKDTEPSDPMEEKTLDQFIIKLMFLASRKNKQAWPFL